MHILFALVTIYFTYVNEFKVRVKSESVRKSFVCKQEVERLSPNFLSRYTRGPPAYKPFFMLALTMKRLSTPALEEWGEGGRPAFRYIYSNNTYFVPVVFSN